MKWYEDPVYIKMCKKAEEIQKAWKPQLGDRCMVYGAGTNLIEALVIDEKDFERGGGIYLPSQEQLQEMVQGTEFWWGLNIRFTHWVKEQSIFFLSKHNSGNQLWLAFVMKEKYNKVWNGEDWIEEG